MTVAFRPAPAVDPIGLMMPWTGEGERKHRNALLKAQQLSAHPALGSSSATARDLFWLINSTAAANATAAASVDELVNLREGLCNLFLAADMFERRDAANG